MKYKISVIVPVYNVEKYILRCLNSIAFQTFKDYEIIIVDDGSTDNSANIVKDFIKSHQDIHINFVKQENAGQAAARNKALSFAEGEYVCFIDSDDYIAEDMLASLYKEATILNYDIVVCDMNIVYDNKDIKYYKYMSDLSEDSIKNYIISNAGPCAKIIKTNLIKDNNLYFPQGIIYEDLAIVPAYGLYANKIGYVPKPYYNYFQRTNSTMNQTMYNSKYENIFLALENLKNEFKKSGKLDMYKSELEYVYINNLLRNASFRLLPYINDTRALVNAYNIVNTMKQSFPKYKKNIYFKTHSFKYKFVTNLLYCRQIKLLKYTSKGAR